MFEQSLLTGAARTRRAWTVPLGFAAQVGAIAGLALIPLVFFEGIPVARLMPPQLTVPRPYHAEVERHNVAQVVGVKYVHRPDNVFREPSKIQVGVHLPKEEPQEPIEYANRCTGLCVPDSVGPSDLVPVTRTVLPDTGTEVPQPVVRGTPRPTPTPAPIRVSSGVQEAKLVHRVLPVYPSLAIKLRIEGVVHLAAIVGSDGRMKALQLVSGHPLLAPAALDAVRQWVYLPTMLNGAPVEVMTEITVTFNLSH